MSGYLLLIPRGDKTSPIIFRRARLWPYHLVMAPRAMTQSHQLQYYNYCHYWTQASLIQCHEDRSRVTSVHRLHLTLKMPSVHRRGPTLRHRYNHPGNLLRGSFVINFKIVFYKSKLRSVVYVQRNQSRQLVWLSPQTVDNYQYSLPKALGIYVMQTLHIPTYLTDTDCTVIR